MIGITTATYITRRNLIFKLVNFVQFVDIVLYTILREINKKKKNVFVCLVSAFFFFYVHTFFHSITFHKTVIKMSIVKMCYSLYKTDL